MNIKKIIFSIALFATGMLLWTSCQQSTPEQESERSIRLVYTDWSESIAITHLSSVLLEEQMDYEVITQLTDVESAYKALAENTADVFADAWLPETQKHLYKKYRSELDKTGIIYPEARTGLVVPQYSPLKSLSDLSDYPYAIVGIDSGAGVMHRSRQMIDRLALDNPLLVLSEQEMVRHLKDSIQRRKNIVITGWEPHWIFARYELRFLEDPSHIFGENEKIYALSRKNLESQHPNAKRFFERMQLSEKQFNSLIYEVSISEDPEVGVRRWIKKHEFITNQWVKDLHRERKKIM
ncbi:MAG: glycine betaine ABC transporter substrate-binding protein [Bacteroidales bacterium]